MWGRTSGGIPAPPSATPRQAKRAPSSRRTFWISIRSHPPSGIASRALPARFMSTWSRWLGSTSTGHGLGAGTTSSDTSSPRLRRRSPSSRVTAAFRSVRTGLDRPVRLKVRSCATRFAARAPAARMCATSSRCSGESVPSVRKSQPLRITTRRLLKSWATPAASRPTASSRPACRSCSSSRRRSVTSRITTCASPSASCLPIISTGVSPPSDRSSLRSVTTVSPALTSSARNGLARSCASENSARRFRPTRSDRGRPVRTAACSLAWVITRSRSTRTIASAARSKASRARSSLAARASTMRWWRSSRSVMSCTVPAIRAGRPSAPGTSWAIEWTSRIAPSSARRIRKRSSYVPVPARSARSARSRAARCSGSGRSCTISSGRVRSGVTGTP
jgi:hypothetical protein